LPTLPTGITRSSGTTYDVLTIDLGIARDNVGIEISGDVISRIYIDGELDLRLNEKDEPIIELDKIIRIDVRPSKFKKLFFTNTAQTGKSCILHIGREASYVSEPGRWGVVGLLDAVEARINPAKEDGVLTNLDITLTNLAKRQRWGREIEPEWIHASEVTAPAAATNLVSKTVGAGKSGYIYGFLITTGEANDFLINWTSGGTAYSIRVTFTSSGTTEAIDNVPLNEGLPADAGTTITIQNVNAGAAGIIYQARLLYAET